MTFIKEVANWKILQILFIECFELHDTMNWFGECMQKLTKSNQEKDGKIL